MEFLHFITEFNKNRNFSKLNNHMVEGVPPHFSSRMTIQRNFQNLQKISFMIHIQQIILFYPINHRNLRGKSPKIFITHKPIPLVIKLIPKLLNILHLILINCSIFHLNNI